MDKKHILTLTTDLGIRDYYTAILKAAALQADSNISIVDITHQIKDFNISKAAYIFKNAYQHFPPDTIHFLAVNADRADCKQFLLFKHRNQYFIGPDNGIFSLIFEDEPEIVYSIPYLKEEKFPIKNILTTALETVLNEDFGQLGTKTNDYLKKIALQPVTGNAMIRGSVLHIDNFDNVVVNIHRELFEYIRDDRNFEIYYKGWDPITEVSEQYQDVPTGEILARFNSADYLEIAINMGRAASTLGLEIDDNIQIDFL